MSNVILREETDLQTNAVLSNQNHFPMISHQQTVALLRSPNLTNQDLPTGVPYVIQEIETWDEVADFFCDDHSGCLLVDFDHNREQLIASLHRLMDDWVLLPIIACSACNEGSTAIQAAKAGCIEFVSMPMQCEDLLNAVRRACAFDAFGDDPPSLFRKRLASLTVREREVLRLFLEGMNTKTIAKQLTVSYQTIDKHRNRALKKMHCGSLVDLCRTLYQKQSWSL